MRPVSRFRFRNSETRRSKRPRSVGMRPFNPSPARFSPVMRPSGPSTDTPRQRSTGTALLQFKATSPAKMSLIASRTAQSAPGSPAGEVSQYRRPSSWTVDRNADHSEMPPDKPATLASIAIPINPAAAKTRTKVPGMRTLVNRNTTASAPSATNAVRDAVARLAATPAARPNQPSARGPPLVSNAMASATVVQAARLASLGSRKAPVRRNGIR